MAQTKTIEQDLTEAMKAHDSLRVSTLRMILAALKNEQIAKREPLNEEEEKIILQKEIKKRLQAAELYNRGRRPELAQKEEAEIKIIKEYLAGVL
ncbi:MAG: GatB/YqeY domain-containing protein [Patescibacteria group bacterium]|nr:GatB/YqeY domain-containing protein [Patescibacteria group bacterium]